MTNPAPPAPIVVGTDGSPASGPAVCFALQESQLRRTRLRAVCAYDFTTRYSGFEWPAASGFHDLDTQLRDTTVEAVTKALQEAREQVGGASVEVEIRVEKFVHRDAVASGLLMKGGALQQQERGFRATVAKAEPRATVTTRSKPFSLANARWPDARTSITRARYAGHTRRLIPESKSM
jgi:hypothetical protein